jgi:hypothetical protein
MMLVLMVVLLIVEGWGDKPADITSTYSSVTNIVPNIDTFGYEPSKE